MSGIPGGSSRVEVVPTSGPRRGLWVVVFLVGGVFAIFSVFLSLFDLNAGLPWIGASSAMAALAGYSIWRADHPRLSARRTIIERLGPAITGIAAIVALLLSRENLALAGTVVAALFVALLGLLLVVDRLGRSGAGDKP